MSNPAPKIKYWETLRATPGRQLIFRITAASDQEGAKASRCRGLVAGGIGPDFRSGGADDAQRQGIIENGWRVQHLMRGAPQRYAKRSAASKAWLHEALLQRERRGFAGWVEERQGDDLRRYRVANCFYGQFHLESGSRCRALPAQ